MTTTLNLTDPVGDWVTGHPATSLVFERHRIDFCCSGQHSLEDACWSRQIDAQAVLAELLQIVSHESEHHDPDGDFASMSLTEMCDAIEMTHHEYLKRELPRLTQLIEKVVSVHGEQHSWLRTLARLFRRLCGELIPHMFKEEQILFPAIRMIEESGAIPPFPFGSVDNPIRMMENEHDHAGQALEEIRAVSSDFTLPPDGCHTFQALLEGLRELETDLHRHIHKENNVLFPRASRLAADISRQSAVGSST